MKQRRRPAQSPPNPVESAMAAGLDESNSARSLRLIEAEEVSTGSYLDRVSAEAPETSVRPRPRPTHAPTSSPRPVRRPEPTSIRPVPRPTPQAEVPSPASAEQQAAPTKSDSAAVSVTDLPHVHSDVHPLASLLSVKDPSAMGPNLPNQVWPDEFDEAAATYDSVVDGTGNLQVHEDDPDARAGIHSDMARIMETRMGRELMADLATDRDGADFMMMVASSKERDEAGYALILGDEEQHENATNGTGAHAGVLYTPSVEQDFRRGSLTEEPWAKMDSPTHLVHEMIHGYRTHHGIRSEGVVDEEATSRWDRGRAAVEEYETVGLAGMGGAYTENAYRAERSLIDDEEVPQRTSYMGDTPRERMKR